MALNLKKDTYLPDKSIKKDARKVDYHDIEAIENDEPLVVIGSNFFNPILCERFSSRLMNSENLESYAVAEDILKIGKAIFDAADNPSELQTYYESARPNLDQTRRFFSPYISPIDLLRVTLQEIWPSGSNLESLHGKTMYCGLTRVFKEGSAAFPHQDMSHWDVPDSLAAWSQKTQLAGNIYLKMPSSGGELELWDYGFDTKADYIANTVPGSYGLDRNKIGPPALKIKPEQGDLILFDARRIHAVSTIEKGCRITSSCFLGYRGVTQPLAIYS